jgi:hypothetical protein
MNDFEVEVKFIPSFKDQESKKKFFDYMGSQMHPRAQWYITGKHPMRISYRNGVHKFTVKFGSGKDYARIEIEKQIETEVAKMLVENYCSTWVFKNHMEWMLSNGEVMEINHFLKSSGLSMNAVIIEVEYNSSMLTEEKIENTKREILKELSPWINGVEVVNPSDHSLDNYGVAVQMKKEDKFISNEEDAYQMLMTITIKEEN